MQQGDSLFLYTDGFSETLDRSGSEYGKDRLSQLLADNHQLPCKDLLEMCLRDLHVFGGGYPASDDLTLMSIQRVD
jgi:sigma-B regulation protein RsbU (phosphoserine phosphatase)